MIEKTMYEIDLGTSVGKDQKHEKCLAQKFMSETQIKEMLEMLGFRNLNDAHAHGCTDLDIVLCADACLVGFTLPSDWYTGLPNDSEEEDGI